MGRYDSRAAIYCRPKQYLVDQFRIHDVAKISDAMGKYGSLDPEIKPLQDGMRINGVARTLRCYPGDLQTVLDTVCYLQEGDILVIDACGDTQFSCADTQTYKALQSVGAGGLVVNGAVRDRAAAIKSGIPIFARAIAQRQMPRGEFSMDVPINAGGLVIYPYDLIVGDDDGVVAVPAHDLERVIGLTNAKLEKELSNQAKINEGAIMTVLYGCEAKIDKWREPQQTRGDEVK